MDYDGIFRSAIERLHDEGRYRVFIDILRTKGSFPDARCFAHTATAHGESWGGSGCSPWMSAILADALEARSRTKTFSFDVAFAREFQMA